MQIPPQIETQKVCHLDAGNETTAANEQNIKLIGKHQHYSSFAKG